MPHCRSTSTAPCFCSSARSSTSLEPIALIVYGALYFTPFTVTLPPVHLSLIHILSGVWRGILCTLLPVGLGAWYPAELLLHGAPGAAPYLLPPVIAALFAAAAVFTFQKGMKHYAIYACPRYSGFGHR